MLNPIKKWNQEFTLPKWKFYIVKLYRFFCRKENKKEFLFKVIEMSLGTLMLILLILALMSLEPEEVYQQPNVKQQTHAPKNK